MTDPSDDDKYLAYGQALRSAVDDAITPWLHSTLNARTDTQTVPDAVADAIETTRANAYANITRLIEADVHEPLSGPLEQIRQAVLPLGPVLDEHGFQRPARHPSDQEMRPDDVHDLGPVAFVDLGDAVQTAGIAWGAAKAHVFLSGRPPDASR